MLRTNLTIIALMIFAGTAMAGNKLVSTSKDKITWYQKHRGVLAWNQVVMVCTTPEEISSAVNRHIEYRSDDLDEWKSGEKTWVDGVGDCEDIAECVVALCDDVGLVSWVEVVFDEKSREAHAVAVGTYNGRMWMCDNGVYSEVDSIDDIKTKIAADLNWKNDETKTVKFAELKAAKEELDDDIAVASAINLGVMKNEGDSDLPKTTDLFFAVKLSFAAKTQDSDR